MKSLFLAALITASMATQAAQTISFNLDCDGSPALFQVSYTDSGAKKNRIVYQGVDYKLSGGTRKEQNEYGDIVTTQFAGIDADNQVAVSFTRAELEQKKMYLVSDHGNSVSRCTIISGL